MGPHAKHQAMALPCWLLLLFCVNVSGTVEQRRARMICRIISEMPGVLEVLDGPSDVNQM